MSDPTPSPTEADALYRARLGNNLVGWSLCAIAVIAVVILGAAAGVDLRKDKPDGKELMEAGKLLLSVLLPLFGTWVGTVLAFYFSKENFESANRATMALVRTATGVLDTLKVAEKMIPRWRIAGLVVPAGKTIGDLTGDAIAAGFDSKIDGKPISRLPFFDDKGVGLGILHRSVWLEMRVAGTAGEQPYVSTEPFSRLMKISNPATPGKTYAAVVTDTIAFVPPAATLAEAKRAMEGLAGCQDVFVTTEGKREEPVVGWLPNVDIARASRA